MKYALVGTVQALPLCGHVTVDGNLQTSELCNPFLSIAGKVATTPFAPDALLSGKILARAKPVHRPPGKVYLTLWKSYLSGIQQKFKQCLFNEYSIYHMTRLPTASLRYHIHHRDLRKDR